MLPGGTAKIHVGSYAGFSVTSDQSAWLSGIWMTFLIHLGLDLELLAQQIVRPTVAAGV